MVVVGFSSVLRGTAGNEPKDLRNKLSKSSALFAEAASTINQPP